MFLNYKLTQCVYLDVIGNGLTTVILKQPNKL